MSARILVLSGYACTSRIWRAVQEALSPDYQFTLVEWPTQHTPSFERIDDFAAWLQQQYPIEAYPVIIGHSLGGLVAAQALAQNRTPGVQLILVESFLLPPGPFFQNLLMPGTDREISASITDMLEAQRGFFAPPLAQSLRIVDFTKNTHARELRIAAIYGDRGCGQPERVIQALNWPADWRIHFPVEVVANACHFPMVENPHETASILKRIIGNIALKENKSG